MANSAPLQVTHKQGSLEVVWGTGLSELRRVPCSWFRGWETQLGWEWHGHSRECLLGQGMGECHSPGGYERQLRRCGNVTPPWDEQGIHTGAGGRSRWNENIFHLAVMSGPGQCRRVRTAYAGAKGRRPWLERNFVPERQKIIRT